MHGLAAQVPVDLNVVAVFRTAGSGEMLKSATGAAGLRAAWPVATVAEVMSRHAKAMPGMKRRKRGLPEVLGS